MGKYTYDTWGKVLSVTDANGTLITDTNHIGHRNPIRYRGYYYDIETGLYYLQSRYYDPEVGRFISADAFAVLGATPMDVTDKNLFAYCDNNPVMRIDNGGEFWHILAGAIIGSVSNLISAAVAQMTEPDELGLFDLAQVLVSSVIGGAEGACTAALPAGKVVFSTVFGAVDSIASDLIDKKSKKEITRNAIASGLFSFVGSYMSEIDIGKITKAGDDFCKMYNASEDGFNRWLDITDEYINPKANSKINDVIVKRAADDSAELITNLVFPEE